MGFELFLLPVPPGCDLEEAGEALLTRIASGHERASLTETGRAEAVALAEGLAAREPDLVPTADTATAIPGTVEMRATSGVQVVIARRFARFLVPFSHHGEDAAVAFRQLFALASALADATGWLPYDPQEGEPASLTEEGCADALEVYLSVMDQLRPAGAAGPRRERS